MKLLQGQIYIEFDQLVSIGISENTIRKGYERGSSSWVKANDPSDMRKALIQYDTLAPKYKHLVKTSLFDGKEPRQFLQEQKAAEKASLQSSLPDLIELDPKEYAEIVEYGKAYKTFTPADAFDIARASAYCRFYNNITSKAQAQALGFNKVSDIQQELMLLAQSEGIKALAVSNFRRFQEKFTKYKEQGFKGLVSGRYGNRNTAKLESKEQKALLRQLYARTNNYSFERITDEYNRIAQAAGWKPVSVSTVKAFLGDGTVQNQARSTRNGMRVWAAEFNFSTPGQRPSKPNYLWVGDGTPCEFYYRKDKANSDKSVTSYWNRKVVYPVLDAFNDLVIGLHISDSENAEGVRYAWRQACMNTGALPWQVNMDHGPGNNANSEMFLRIARYVTPSSVGNPRKLIEPFFKQINEQLGKEYVNYAGANITAKKTDSHGNKEWLEQNKKYFPNEQEVIIQIQEFFTRWNTTPRKNKPSRLDEWKAADHSEDRPLTHESKLLIFGQVKDRTIQLTNQGIVCQFGTERIPYMLFDNDWYSANIGKSFTVYFDEDSSRIAAVSPEGQVYVLPEITKNKWAIKDRTPADFDNLARIEAFKQEHKRRTQEANMADFQTIERLQQRKIELEGFVKGAFTHKGVHKNLSYEGQNAMKRLSGGDEFDQPLPDEQVAFQPAKRDEFDY